MFLRVTVCEKEYISDINNDITYVLVLNDVTEKFLNNFIAGKTFCNIVICIMVSWEKFSIQCDQYSFSSSIGSNRLLLTFSSLCCSCELKAC